MRLNRPPQGPPPRSVSEVRPHDLRTHAYLVGGEISDAQSVWLTACRRSVALRGRIFDVSALDRAAREDAYRRGVPLGKQCYACLRRMRADAEVERLLTRALGPERLAELRGKRG